MTITKPFKITVADNGKDMDFHTRDGVHVTMVNEQDGWHLHIFRQGQKEYNGIFAAAAENVEVVQKRFIGLRDHCSMNTGTRNIDALNMMRGTQEVDLIKGGGKVILDVPELTKR